MRRIEDPAAVRLEVRRRHARADHHAQIELQPPRRVEEVLDAGDAEHVGELVRIADRRRRAAREHRALEALRNEQRALEVDVRVDEARHDVRALRVNLARAAEAGLEPDDDAVLDRDVAFDEHAREHVEVAHVAQDEVAGLVPRAARRRRRRTSAGQSFPQRTLTSANV